VARSRTIFPWLMVFGAGFLAGIVFSAWKLETITGPATKQVEEAADRGNQQMEVKTRISGLEKMLAARPNDVDVLIQLGNDHFDLGNYEKAREYYQKALEINPHNADVLTDMGVCLRKLGKPQESVEAFRKAVEVNPGHSLALFNMGIVLRDDLKDYDGALKAWETFLEKAGDSPHAVMIKPWVKQLKEKQQAASQK
jgi:tetratricopeptide (TPR) repeat protein